MQRPFRLLVDYAVAIAATATAVFVRLLLAPVLDYRLPFITLYGAVALAVWFGGWSPALVASVLGYVAVDLIFFQTEPGAPLTWSTPAGATALAAYLLTCAIIIAFGSGLRRARRQAETAAQEATAKQKQLEDEMAEHRGMETVLRAREEELALITSRTPLMLVRSNRDRHYVFVNRASAEFLGRTPEEIIGRPISEVLGKEAYAAIEPYIEQVLRGEEVQFELEIPYFHPGPKFMSVIYTPDRDQDGEVIGWVASITDITERERAERALLASEQRLAAELAAVTRMQQVSTRLVGTDDFSTLLDEILDAAIEITGAAMGNIQLIDDGTLRIVSQRGFDASFIEFFDRTTQAEAACDAAVQRGERVIVEDVTTSEIYAGKATLEVMLAARARAVQSTPLLSRGGGVVGVLSTHYHARRAISDDDLRLLDVLARQAADLIERTNVERALREADRRKDEFLATLAHELRNPLAPVLNAVQILRLNGPGHPQSQWAYEVVDRQVQQMTRLIDDLMDVSRITRNQLELRKERIALAGVLEAAIEMNRPMLDRLGHRLRVDLPSAPICLDADATRLTQVFANLLNNAAKYCEGAGHIWLTARMDGDEVVVSCRDTGVGIAGDLLPRVFEMFMQASHAADRTHGGLGIGLTLVKRLVELHGGAVEAHSEGPGKGSEFLVRLPASAAATATARVAEPEAVGRA